MGFNIETADSNSNYLDTDSSNLYRTLLLQIHYRARGVPDARKPIRNPFVAISGVSKFGAVHGGHIHGRFGKNFGVNR